VEGGVEHHGEGVKLLWGSGDNGAHRATLFTAAVTQSRALAATVRTRSQGAPWSGQEVVRCWWETRGGDGDTCSWLVAPDDGESLIYSGG
jgi:hypothetical protein